MLFIVRQATKLVDIGVKSYVDCANWQFLSDYLEICQKSLAFWLCMEYQLYNWNYPQIKKKNWCVRCICLNIEFVLGNVTGQEKSHCTVK